MAVVLAACTLNDPDPFDQVCLVTEIVRQQRQTADLAEISRQSFTYQTGKLKSFSDRSPNHAITFNFKYVGGKVASAFTSDNATVLSLDYDEFERIEKASYIVNNKERTVFSLNYASQDRTERLVKIVETRVLLPSNSFISSRIFQFSYGTIADRTEDLVAQTVQNGYKDGSRTEEEFTFEQSAANHSPFYDTSQSIVLALLALTNHTEPDAARYLQRFDSKSFTRKVTDSTGAVSRFETNRFNTEYDASFNPVRLTQETQVSIPSDAFSESYQQTFRYNCIE
ncbi:hypothetical protein GCM10027299_00450 [Larkinella ripae]